MKKVLLRAPLLTLSGYGIHSRQVYRWLESRLDIDLTCQVLSWGNTSWLIDSNIEDGMIGRIMSHSRPFEGKFDVTFQLQLPDEWDATLGDVNVGMSAMVETDRCSPTWIENVNKMDLIIVPSNHAKSVIENSGNVLTDIAVVPEWFNQQILKESSDSVLTNVHTDFNFLSVAQFTGDGPSDRKNTLNLVKWFCESFADSKDVGLILKANMGKSTLIDRQLTKDSLMSLVGQVRKGPYPKIHLVHGNLSQSEMASIYASDKVKCFLSITRGEGYGLPLVDAAAAGVPVIATNWSGHLDFLNMGKFIPISYNLVDIPDSRIDNRIFFKGFRWADPLEDDFKIKVKKFRKQPELPKEWAAEMSKKIRERYCEESIMRMYDDIYDNLFKEKN